MFLYTWYCCFLQLYYQCLNFAMIVSSALMIWKGLMVVTGSESPIVVVLRYRIQYLKCKIFLNSKSKLLTVGVWSQLFTAVTCCFWRITTKNRFALATLLCSKSKAEKYPLSTEWLKFTKSTDYQHRFRVEVIFLHLHIAERMAL